MPAHEELAIFIFVQELFRTSLAIVWREQNSQIVVLKRSSVPAVSEPELFEFLARFEALLPTSLRRDLVILMDIRDAPLRNDADYEDRMNRVVVRLVGGFRRVAVLMQTSVGLLQASRLRRERGGATAEIHPFTSEAEARAFLLAAVAAEKS